MHIEVGLALEHMPSPIHKRSNDSSRTKESFHIQWSHNDAQRPGSSKRNRGTSIGFFQHLSIPWLMAPVSFPQKLTFAPWGFITSMMPFRLKERQLSAAMEQKKIIYCFFGLSLAEDAFCCVTVPTQTLPNAELSFQNVFRRRLEHHSNQVATYTQAQEDPSLLCRNVRLF